MSPRNVTRDATCNATDCEFELEYHRVNAENNTNERRVIQQVTADRRMPSRAPNRSPDESLSRAHCAIINKRAVAARLRAASRKRRFASSVPYVKSIRHSTATGEILERRRQPS